MIISANGCAFHVEDFGQGLAVLCIHGFPLNGQLWQPVVEQLAGNNRFIVPDLRGLGRSTATPQATMADYADDLAAILEACGVTAPVVVMGLSMGGYIAFEFYRRHGERVRAMVFADTRPEADTPEKRADRQVKAERVLQEGSRYMADLMLDSLFGPAAPPALRFAWHGIMSSNDPTGVAAALGAMAGRNDSVELLSSIKEPALVIVGEHDAITPPEVHREMCAKLPAGKLVEIPGAGHMTPVEDSAAFASALGSFLSAPA